MSWVSAILPIIGMMGLYVGDRYFTTMGADGAIHEPWMILGPSVWVLLGGITGTVITKIAISVIDRMDRRGAREGV
ncbi:hypothetical protein FHS76_003022 [Ochrobactrum daejeonense]|uniref:Uncharacterized protein n=2 Tax=Brucella daejeonensis TaxID=659015 RepID=A0A7W9ENV5_9HYPH|nr:hypothetical protein [Brucella daejeonensis]